MSQKVERPVLSGQRIKTRKRDEKEKYDPAAFRDAVVQGLNEAGTDLDQVSKYLDTAGNRLNYRRYAETLFDILFAGGILAPGGSIVEDVDPTKVSKANVCVFSAEEDIQALQRYYEIFYKLIRRYKYLEKSFESEMTKILVFLKGFSEEERRKLAMITALFLANGLISAQSLNSLFEDHLIKEGIGLDFATTMFEQWLKQKDVNHISNALRRVNLDGKLMNLFPINKRSIETFEKHFRSAGLGQIVDYQKSHQNSQVKKELQVELKNMIKQEDSVKEVIIPFVKDEMKKNGIADHEGCVLVWNTVMNSVEWNKKEELVAEQALRHLKIYSPLLASLCVTSRAEIALLVKVQDFCYDNMNFMKVFQKIIVTFYKSDVVSEDTILRWYKELHSSKGKTVFLAQMKSFVEWLEQAEEETDESGEED